MNVLPTRLSGAMLIQPVSHSDVRGSFTRVFCAETFRRHGLEAEFVQANQSSNPLRGTLRGLHFQTGEAAEVKLVRAVRGAIRDVIVDLRPASPTFRQWQGFDLTETNRHILYVPRGFAHGFQTLTDAAEVVYHVSAPYTPAAEGGLRWDDPAIGIDWPLPVTLMSDKDANWPLIEAAQA